MSNNLVMPARNVVETDYVSHAGDGFMRGPQSGVVTRAINDSGVVYLWLDGSNNRDADIILNHGDPIRVRRDATEPLVNALTWEGDQA